MSSGMQPDNINPYETGQWTQLIAGNWIEKDGHTYPISYTVDARRPSDLVVWDDIDTDDRELIHRNLENVLGRYYQQQQQEGDSSSALMAHHHEFTIRDVAIMATECTERKHGFMYRAFVPPCLTVPIYMNNPDELLWWLNQGWTKQLLMAKNLHNFWWAFVGTVANYNRDHFLLQATREPGEFAAVSRYGDNRQPLALCDAPSGETTFDFDAIRDALGRRRAAMIPPHTFGGQTGLQYHHRFGYRSLRIHFENEVTVQEFKEHPDQDEIFRNLDLFIGEFYGPDGSPMPQYKCPLIRVNEGLVAQAYTTKMKWYEELNFTVPYELIFASCDLEKNETYWSHEVTGHEERDC